MTIAPIQLSICLIAGVSIIVLLTARYRVHAFFALLIASFVVGLGTQLPAPDIINAIKDGFGSIMKSLGLIIVLGTALGVLLEHTGSTRVMAAFILRQVGERHAVLAIGITGFIVGLPIFCDSGYIVLSGLNRSLARRTGISMAAMAVSLAAGLYSVHCLIPPHPGATAAASVIGVDFGKLILTGIVVAIPAAMAGYFWANFTGRKIPVTAVEEEIMAEETSRPPSVIKAFLPVVVPIFLIAVRSFFIIQASAVKGWWFSALLSVGDPVIALSIGVLLAFNCHRTWNKETVGHLLEEAAGKAGGILVIIGAGGAFGAVLAATDIGRCFSQRLALDSLGILFPFMITSVLKTAQGSSTVAIITAASIVRPLLPALGLATEKGQLFAVLAMGAGSMMISHVNDAYFWVIAKFSGLEMKTMLKVYSVASLLMGLVSLLMIYLLSLVLP
ncbi:MAG TPA: GntP family permease [Candidatus Limnocylindrales bacterium]|nr:GntP family permease [Candidatus Limnocylindrales bacterium]